MSARALCLTLALAFAGCATPRDVEATHKRSSQAPPLSAITRVFDVKRDREVSLEAAIDAIDSADAVFLGETHLDDTTHRVEIAVYEGLVRRRGNVILALEMFERDVQPSLDDYLGGRIPETEFLARSRPWGNYWTGYRPLIEAAKRHGLPVVAANVPTDVRRKLALGGREAFDALSAAERALLPSEIRPESDAYWARVDRAVHGHGGGGPVPSATDRLYSTQSLWDNSMAEACAKALERRPGSVVFHVNGAFHSDYRDGLVAQFTKRRPEARVRTLSVIPTDDLHSIDATLDRDRADFLVYAEARARGLSGGTHAVSTSAELRFRLDVPKVLPPSNRVPLVIWLPDDGGRAKDAQALFHAALGDEAAVAVIEAPYAETADDLHVGGRWSFLESFAEDQGRILEGLTRIFEYVTRHYPVDPARVIVAGDGSGGTAVVFAALYARRLPVSMLALEPTRLKKLAEQAMPDDPPSTRDLAIVPADGTKASVEELVAQARGAGLDASIEELSGSAPSLSFAVEARIRAALGLAERSADAARRSGPCTLLVLDAETQLGLDWAAIFARALEKDGGVALVVRPSDLSDAISRLRGEGRTIRLRPMSFRIRPTDDAGSEWLDPFGPRDLSDGKALPLAPGEFGGTTVLVVSSLATDEDRSAWLALEEKKVLQTRSRFSSLRVAFDEAEPSLGSVLDAIRDSGRSNVLIVPAAYAATPEEMRRLEAVASAHGRGLELSYLPGLGGDLRP